MRKWAVIVGLIIMTTGVFPLIIQILGLGTRLDNTVVGESRFPILMMLPFRII